MNLQNVELARIAIPMVLAVLGARPRDVLNADETRIVLGSQRMKTLVFQRTPGVKKDKDRHVHFFSQPAAYMTRPLFNI